MATTFDRKDKLIEDIMKTMEKRSTEELINIYSENDVDKYSDEAFEAINRLLSQRGERIPFRDTGKKRVNRSIRPKTVCGLGWRGLLISLIVWSPVLLFFYYRFGIREILYAENLHKGIAAGAFLVTGIIAEKMICRVKGH